MAEIQYGIPSQDEAAEYMRQFAETVAANYAGYFLSLADSEALTLAVKEGAGTAGSVGGTCWGARIAGVGRGDGGVEGRYAVGGRCRRLRRGKGLGSGAARGVTGRWDPGAEPNGWARFADKWEG